MNTKTMIAAAASAVALAVATPRVALAGVTLNVPASYGTIADALAAASEGDTISVAAGTYVLTDTLDVEKGVVLTGAGGGETILSGNGATLSLMRVLDSGAFVSGLVFEKTVAGTAQSDDSVTNSPLFIAAGTVSNCVVRGCTIKTGCGDGGAPVYMTNGLFVASVVSNNTTSGSFAAGGLHIRGGEALHCVIAGNKVPVNGPACGGVLTDGGRVADCDISDNSGTTYLMNSGKTAMGVRMNSGLMERCTICCNANANGELGAGGGVYMAGAATNRNCLIAGNTSKNSDANRLPAAGLVLADSKAVVENATIVGNYNLNSAIYDGVAISAGTLRNSIVSGNGDTAGDLNVKKTGGTVSYCCYPESDGSNNCTADAPMFVDAAAGDYRLAFGSAGIDAGLALDGFADDLDGASRPVDGLGDGTAVWDMGCYEWRLADGETFACRLTTDAAEYAAPASVVCTPVVGTLTTIGSCSWAIASGATTNTYISGGSGAYTASNLAAGRYTVTLTVTAVGGAKATSLPVTVSVLSTVTYVSTIGSHTWPFDTEETASTNLLEAVEVTVGGGAVHVAAGTYAAGKTVNGTFDTAGEADYLANVTKAVRIVGAGAASTVFQCGKPLTGKACGIRIANAGASIEGVTVTGATAGNAVDLVAGVVSNCIVVGNACDQKYRGNVRVDGGLLAGTVVSNNAVTVNESVGGVYLTGGEVRRCRIVSNRSSAYGAIGAGVNQTGGTLADCDISFNSGEAMYDNNGNAAMGVRLSGGLMERCTVCCNTNTFGNHGAVGGVNIVGAATVRNCLVAGNYSLSTDNSHCSASGICMNNANAVVECCTVTANVNPNSTALDGVNMRGGTLHNTIVYGNGDAAGDTNLCYAAGTATYSCFPEAAGGIGSDNQSAAPKFRDAAIGDYRLDASATSCINMGENGTWTANDIDLSGDPRINRKIIDIGAYEFKSGAGFVISIQ